MKPDIKDQVNKLSQDTPHELKSDNNAGEDSPPEGDVAAKYSSEEDFEEESRSKSKSKGKKKVKKQKKKSSQKKEKVFEALDIQQQSIEGLVPTVQSNLPKTLMDALQYENPKKLLKINLDDTTFDQIYYGYKAALDKG
ncbi:hypothetical protein DFH28DRAFT_1124666 [Melampsora americana]|nr:hypothetical protein DFH28DRAFT_1124666 [Melampsora americana]